MPRIDGRAFNWRLWVGTPLAGGSGKKWAELREVIEKLDRSVPSVLIEVLVAEVSLNDEEKTGFEFLVNGALGSRGLTVGTLNTLGVGAGGLSFTLDSAGQTRAMLNFFRKDDRVVIRSRPRLLVESGETASIDVGNEIPVVTQRGPHSGAGASPRSRSRPTSSVATRASAARRARASSW